MVRQKSPFYSINRTRPADKEPLLEVWLPAEAEAVPAARRAALRACEGAGVETNECIELDLALGEALANAVLHGRSEKADDDICVSVWDYHDHLIVQVINHGLDFDPPPPPYPMPPAGEQATHGRGLPLMETLTDAMLVSRGDVQEGGSSIYLIKALGSKNKAAV